MKKFIAAVALVAPQWQPAHAQMILGSIPEEFRGDHCWQEKTNGEQIFRPGACKLKSGSLSIDRMTRDTGRLSCVFDSGTANDGASRCGCTAPIPRKSNHRCTVPSSSNSLARRSNSSQSRWINSDCSAGVIKLRAASGRSINGEVRLLDSTLHRDVCQEDNVMKYE